MAEQSVTISRRTFLGGVAAFSVISLVASPMAAFADPTAAEKQAEADQVRTQYNSLLAELQDLSNVYGAALDEHDAAVVAMNDAQVRIDEANEKIGGLQDRLGTRVRSMYRSGGGSSFLDILVSATSFEEFATNWDLLTKLNEDDAELVQEVKDLRAEIQASHDEYARQEKVASEKLEEARVAKETHEATTAEYKSLLDTLDAETLALLQAEQEAAAALAAQQAIAAQGPAPQQAGGDDGGNGGGNDGGSDGGTYNGGSAADFGPPAGDVVTEASKYVGIVPYVSGGNSPEQGFDCSGFVNYCLSRCGRSIPPRCTYNYPDSGWFPVSEAQPGDVLWQYNHVAICASPGGGSYIHAPQPGQTVSYSSWSQFTRAYRY